MSTTPTKPPKEPQGRRAERTQRLFRRAPRRPLPPQGSLRWSFTWAFEGIVYVLRTQRNMRIHLTAGIVALVLALVLDVTRLEFIAVLGAVSLVLIAEMINTAIEAAIDALVTHYHPLVKVAKDVSAGAVLVATVNALAVAYLVFYNHITQPTNDLIGRVHGAPSQIVVASLIVTVALAVAIKAATGRGTPLRGGLPSGHAAAAFAGWAAITIAASGVAHAALITTLSFMMALLVAQSRVEAGIHSGIEVIAGAVIGTCVTVLMFQLWG